MSNHQMLLAVSLVSTVFWGCAADLIAQGRATLVLRPSAGLFQKVHVEKDGNETVVHGRARPLPSCDGRHVDLTIFDPKGKVLWKEGTALVSRTVRRGWKVRRSRRIQSFSFSIPMALPKGATVQVVLRCRVARGPGMGSETVSVATSDPRPQSLPPLEARRTLGA